MITVKKLHLGIHLGYAISNLAATYRPAFVALLGLYEDYAMKLPEDELMVVCKEISWSKMREDWKEYKQPSEFTKMIAESFAEFATKKWPDCLAAMRQCLGRRLMVLGARHDIFNGLPAVVDVITRIGTARGLSIKKAVPKVCFGEYGVACVSAAARELARSFEDDDPIPILWELTDVPIRRQIGLGE